jgi:predicted ATPase
MIKRISIDNFKSLRKVDLSLGRLNLLIGTNASGKSNFLDALQVLRLLAGGFPVKEAFEGGVQTTAGDTWSGLRGGLANAIYRPTGVAKTPPGIDALFNVELKTDTGVAQYEIGFNSKGAVTREHFNHEGKEIFSYDGSDAFFRNPDNTLTSCYPNPFSGSQMISGLVAGFAGARKDLVSALVRALQSMQFLGLNPDILRKYGAAADTKVIGRDGRNFASVVRQICSDPKTKESYLAWLRELRPHELDDVTTLSGAVGEPMFALKESGREFPAPVLSGGTLRFAALAAAFFQPSMPGVLTIEEVENGIHGSRLRLLLELFRTQTTATKTQLIATTHSPLLLAWLNPAEFENTFLCKRDQETGESRILPLAQVPHFNEIIGKHPITELFAEGWMEEAV